MEGEGRKIKREEKEMWKDKVMHIKKYKKEERLEKNRERGMKEAGVLVNKMTIITDGYEGKKWKKFLDG
jgi:hypothetical protein